MQRRVEDESFATLTVAAVARRLGVAPTTLRTWDRRYGLGPSSRASGAHRRYTSGDVARLEAMRRLVLSGVTPAEAARVALCGPAALAAKAGALAATEPTRFAGTGGRVLSLAHGTPQMRGLARAAMTLDADAVTETLQHAVVRDGVVATWDNMLRPLLVAIGQRWEHTGEGVDVEHLLTECATRVLHRQPLATGSDAGPRPALLACVPDDQHALPLLVLAAALGERHVGCLLLGAATPLDAMRDAVRRCGPAAVVLWSQSRETADIAAFESVPRLRPPSTLIAAGQGWPAAPPPNVIYAGNLRQGIDLITTAVQGS